VINNRTAANRVEKSALALARELFGQKVLYVDSIARGVINHKFKVTLLDGESYAIRFYPPSREQVVNYEPDVLRRCATAGLPVPKVFTDSRFGPGAGLNYTIYHWVQGVPLDERLPSLDRHCVTSLATELVSYLRRLAELEITGYGDLISATQAKFSTWTAFLGATFSEFESAEIKSPWDRETMKMLQIFWEGVVSAWSVLKPVLAWGDLSPENILLDTEDKIAGLIDFEGTIAADFSLTIGYCYARHFNTPFFDALWNIWPKEGIRPLDQTIQFYAILRGLRLARFASLRLPTGRARDSVDQVLPGFREVLTKLRNQF
jgi:aminoglycoside phosphotransferase (APT) family kinase protein